MEAVLEDDGSIDGVAMLFAIGSLACGVLLDKDLVTWRKNSLCRGTCTRTCVPVMRDA